MRVPDTDPGSGPQTRVVLTPDSREVIAGYYKLCLSAAKSFAGNPPRWSSHERISVADSKLSGVREIVLFPASTNNYVRLCRHLLQTYFKRGVG